MRDSGNTNFVSFPVHDPVVIKKRVLNWLRRFNTFCFLDSNQYNDTYTKHQILIGAGYKRKCESCDHDALHQLQQFVFHKKCWLFGHLNYELSTNENIIFHQKPDELHFPDVYFFEPQVILQIKDNALLICAEEPDNVFKQIQCSIDEDFCHSGIAEIKNKISKEAYISIIQKLKSHIHRGDCYEINFCQEFYSYDAVIDPFIVFEKLMDVSPNPFSAFYNIEGRWLICASPERFLQKLNNTIISQPIKGTLARTTMADDSERRALFNSAKDKAENVMVVDLVRNDLSKICEEATVKVDELFGIYTFPQVHQMISTVSGIVKEDINFEQVIQATFPMGSMTGAPKMEVMKLIDMYEPSKRGIFSGCVGYISPDGNFDLNVVIRSILYNQHTQYLSYQAGSGITMYSDAEKEWEECMIKAKAIKQILQSL